MRGSEGITVPCCFRREAGGERQVRDDGDGAQRVLAAHEPHNQSAREARLRGLPLLLQQRPGARRGRRQVAGYVLVFYSCSTISGCRVRTRVL